MVRPIDPGEAGTAKVVALAVKTGVGVVAPMVAYGLLALGVTVAVMVVAGARIELAAIWKVVGSSVVDGITEVTVCEAFGVTTQTGLVETLRATVTVTVFAAAAAAP